MDASAPPPTALTGRLFTALWPDAPRRRALQAWQSAFAWPAAARPTPAHDLHLTVVFIGAVPAALLPAIAAAVAEPPPALELRLDRSAMWQHRLAVLAGPPVPADFARWQQVQAAALRSLGLAIDERPYRPHVTLARSAGGSVAPALPLPALAWPVRGHVLAMRDGARYRVLRRYGHGAAAAH